MLDNDKYIGISFVGKGSTPYLRVTHLRLMYVAALVRQAVRLWCY